MEDFLDILAKDSRATCESGYYRDAGTQKCRHERSSLREGIIKCRKNAIISEIKRSSPSKGAIRLNMNVASVASAMRRGGAAGISVLTEPKHFKGSLRDLLLARESASIPILMKDIVVDRSQVDAAARLGADAVLLIKGVFERKYADCDLEGMIDHVHSKKMEVLLEVHTEDEFRSAIGLKADLMGINNRDLKTLRVDIHTTDAILGNCKSDSVIVSESGIESLADVRLLRGAGARAFLVGTSVMSAGNVEERVRELVEA